MSNPDVKDEAGDRAKLPRLSHSSALAKFADSDSDKVIGYYCWVSAETELFSTMREAYAQAKAMVDCYEVALSSDANDKRIAEAAYEPQFSTDWEREDYRRQKLSLPGLGPRVFVQPEAAESQLRLTGTEDAGVRALVEAAEGEEIVATVAANFKADPERIMAENPPPETGWLIEMPSKSGPPTWWSLTETEGEGGYFSSDSVKALRFARKQDAEAYIEDVCWTEAVATEHEWVDATITRRT